MAKIEQVDYITLNTNANDMQNKGEELDGIMRNIYEEIRDLHNHWYGKRYNELVKSFNGMRGQVNDILNLVVDDIPYTLHSIAHNYSTVDGDESIAKPTETKRQQIPELTAPTDTGMKYLSSEVEQKQKSVEGKFGDAKEKMDEIQNYFKTQVQSHWDSDAASAFATKLNTLRDNITNSFNEIKSQFAALMNQTEADISAAETANTVQ